MYWILKTRLGFDLKRFNLARYMQQLDEVREGHWFFGGGKKLIGGV